MHLSPSARLLLKLLMALFISIYYTLDLNWTLICSSVTFYQPWHVVFDTGERRLSMHVRRAFQMVPARCSPRTLTTARHTPLRSPLAASLHLQSASDSLMSQHTLHRVRAAFNVTGLPHACQHTYMFCCVTASVYLQCHGVQCRAVTNYCFHYQFIPWLFFPVTEWSLNVHWFFWLPVGDIEHNTDLLSPFKLMWWTFLNIFNR